METRLPQEVFRHTALTEQPQQLAQRPGRSEVIGVYNTVYDRLAARRVRLEERFRKGEFATLGGLTTKINNGVTLSADEQQLIRDYVTLLDSQVAYFGRRNLNAAHLVEYIKQRETSGRALGESFRTDRESYQAGNFHQIRGLDHPLEEEILADRFVVPVKDGGRNFAIIDGGPVEGHIRLIDQEIREISAQTDLTERDRNYLLARRRRERDVLFTSSSPLFDQEDSVFHARNQLEAYHNYINELRREWYLPDWFNGEWLIRERRVLNIPLQERGRRRWGCLPWLLPVPIFLLLWPQVIASPCYGTGGQLTIDSYDTSRVRASSFQNNGEPISIKGSIEQKLGYFRMGRDPRVYSPADDAKMRAAVERQREEDPEYVDMFIERATRDRIQTAQRIRADHRLDPSLPSTDFEFDTLTVPFCLSEEQIDQQVRRALEQRRNPQWYHPLVNSWDWFQHHIPRLNIAVK